ncbi:ergothioneine biosynthesis protein EgtC [Bailinhaonella thermotolerans]|uniref:Gamma-glutamyl-hercynylcysteine sulfoxide hydrolase n=1 Tax=Bailinhaonella thermotolerans TaxID=1070861 RepID=A0A3A4AVK2_9ACTN|nr:ergothioneine biosynthesis protein EgtC [Bailinhaonella thermotolerans]RJL30097.1 ergothioneine biosynthesis protein EgtC [Bailinhaonella thermotolerans]
MCRHLAYLGPPTTLRALLYGPAHALVTQSYAPRRQRHGRVNADGFGVGWYHPGRAAPVRYRRSMPMWADLSFADAADVIVSGCVVAAVRDATPGFPVDESCAQPFTCDGWLFSHQGAVGDFAGAEEVLWRDADRVPDARAPVDSAPLFGLAVRRWRRGAALGEGLAAVAAHAASVSPGRYNLLAADGVRLAATACGDDLYVRRGGDAVVIASEPFDDGPGWSAVPGGSLVTADPGGVAVRPIRELTCPPSTPQTRSPTTR